ncbi:PfkB family carbohydrate kinase [Nonomuraea sp. NPDC003727]
MIAVLGECVADAFAGKRPGELMLRVLPGGGPANTAVALARLGTPAGFLGRLSDDVFGELFRERMAASGVDLSACVPAREPSTLAVATLDAHGQARYTFHAEGTADWQWSAAELSADRLDGASCLHTGSLALVREPGASAVADFAARAAATATVSIDPNVRPSLASREDYLSRMPRWCELADILKLSADDVAFLLPGASVAEACALWHAWGARLVVVTMGAEGALVSLDGETAAPTAGPTAGPAAGPTGVQTAGPTAVQTAAPTAAPTVVPTAAQTATVPAVPVEVVDTVGAGDSFTAGLLHRLESRGLLGGRLERLDLAAAAEAAAFGARVAALTCAVPGADPPWADQLAQPDA